MKLTERDFFLKLLSRCERVISHYKNNPLFPEYHMYSSRYERMLEEINQIRNAYLSKTLYQGFNALEITNMLDRNDSNEIKSAILLLNKYYIEKIKKVDR